MLEYQWLEQTVLVLTPIILGMTQAMKNSFWWGIVVKLLPLFTFPLAMWVIYILYDLPLKEILFIGLVVWLSANGLYDNIKFLLNKK